MGRCCKLLVAVLLLCSWSTRAAWTYDWTLRNDQNGKPAGIITNTPWPITESSTAYSVTNDEGAHAYALGTLYFADGARADDTGDGLSLATAKKTIGAAIDAAGTGNKTVVIRGAHDAFDGVYAEYSVGGNLTGHQGASDLERFTITGYGQERPILDGTGLGTYRCFYGYPVNYLTIQRLKIQNYAARGIMISVDGASSTGVNLIDLWVYNCATINSSAGGDGNIHLYASDNTYSVDNAWLFHVRSEHTVMKGIKLADHTHDAIVEWCYVNECGWWDGIGVTPYAHPYCIDIAANTVAQHNLRPILRYNIAGQAVVGNELRYGENFSVHHNEFFDSVKFDKTGMDTSYDATGTFDVRSTIGTGTIYANIFRDNSDSVYPYLLSNVGGSNAPINIYNNLFYCGTTNAKQSLWFYGYTGDNSPKIISLWNNSFYCANVAGKPVVQLEHSTTDSYTFANNIVYQYGAGMCISNGVSTAKGTNLYYYPDGIRGYANPLESGGIEPSTQNFWKTIPSGSFTDNGANLILGSPAIGVANNLNSVFTTDFNYGIRGATWDVGAMQYGTIPINLGRLIDVRELRAKNVH